MAAARGAGRQRAGHDGHADRRRQAESRADAVERDRTMRPMLTLALGGALAATLWAQQFKFNLDHLSSKASDSFDVSLNSSMLQFAAKFLDGKDPDEAKVKKLIVGITGIYIKSFEFKNDGAWASADLDRKSTR